MDSVRCLSWGWSLFADWGLTGRLLQLRVEDVQLRGISWAKLLDPEKKGQWWLGGGNAEEQGPDVRIEVAGAMDAGAVEAERMLELAAAQRMNTDARRAVFCVVMSGEDYMDAFEKLLRLKLPGKQVCRWFIMFSS